MISFKDLVGSQTSPALRRRLQIFLFISVVIAGFIIKDVVIGDLSWWLALAGVAVGTVIGIVVGRMVTIRWHETEEHVVSQMDTAGYIAIGLYILFALSRQWIFGHWLHGVMLTAFTLSVVSGIIFGRLLGMLISIRRVIEEPRA